MFASMLDMCIKLLLDLIAIYSYKKPVSLMFEQNNGSGNTIAIYLLRETSCHLTNSVEK